MSYPTRGSGGEKGKGCGALGCPETPRGLGISGREHSPLFVHSAERNRNAGEMALSWGFRVLTPPFCLVRAGFPGVGGFGLAVTDY